MNDPPKMLREEQLISALKELEGRVAAWKQHVRDLQAHTILQDLYVSGVQSELQASEQRKHKKKSWKLNLDGLPKLLSGEDFYQKVVADDEQRKNKQLEKEKRKEAQGAANTMKQKWDEEGKAQKERNAYALEMWKEEVKFWEREREWAKEAHEKP
ncbi:hypothetical protein H0H87_002705, partial [Tephrocybe sp. NHM501043]